MIMLQVLREKAQGILAWVIVLCIAATFIFFGLGDYFSSGRSSNIAAKVDGESIKWQSVEVLAERFARQYQGQADEKTLQEQALRMLIQRTALLAAAKKQGFRIGEEQVARHLMQIPIFQEKGQFSKEKYLKLLSEAAYSDQNFRHELSQGALVEQWEQGIMKTSFLTLTELKNLVALFDQKRDFGYAVIPFSEYTKGISVPENDINTYYEKHAANFVLPETVAMEYVTLSLDELAKSIQPDKAAIAAFYQEHQSAYTLPERVHVRHILIEARKDDEALDKAAKQKIEAIAKTLKQGGDFAKIAKESSDDPGSAKEGGDLGWFGRGQMVPEFETAAFAMQKKNSISEPIRTQFGYHLIQLVEHQEAKARALADVEPLVEEQLKREKAEALFVVQSEKLTKLALAAKDSLVPLVKQLGLKQQETKAFGRAGGDGIASNPSVLKAAFSELVLKGENSAPLALNDGEIVVLHLKKHTPARQESLSEAKDKIRVLLANQYAQNAVKKMGEKMVQSIRDGEKPVEVAKQQTLNWQQKTNVGRSDANIDRQIVLMAFSLEKAKEAKDSFVRGVMLPNGDYLVIALNAIMPGDWSRLEPEIQNTYRKGLESAMGQWEYSLYMSQTLQGAAITIASSKHE